MNGRNVQILVTYGLLLCYIILYVVFLAHALEGLSDKKFSWNCKNEKCVKETQKNEETKTSLENCQMLCSTPPIWPIPKFMRVANKNCSSFDKKRLSINYDTYKKVKQLLEKATDIFLKHIPDIVETPLEENDINVFKIQIQVEDDSKKLKLSTNESYKLTIKKINNTIKAHIYSVSYFGARHGLETLNQLIWKNSLTNNLMIVHNLEIEDSPSYPYRGLMIDTARNYFSLSQLKKVVDGMSSTKLNALHLHLTDSVSFPLSMKNLPEMADTGAYDKDMIYTEENIKDLVDYSLVRGVRVILEVDAPSHVYEGWNFKKNLVMCGEKDALAAQLNPDNNETLEVLEKIYTNLLNLTQNNEMFHIGGDEVNLECWKETNLANKYFDMHNLWADYMNRMVEKLSIANNNTLPERIVLWNSPLTDRYYTKLNNPKNLVVQHWFGNPYGYLNYGLNVIFSDVGNWYLDCGFGPWRASQKEGVCGPYKNWQDAYKHRPWEDYLPYQKQVLGGEVCLWTELVEKDDLETRIWPRAAAFAERVWSDPTDFVKEDVFKRLAVQRERLVSRGIKVAAIWPRWCSMNPDKC